MPRQGPRQGQVTWGWWACWEVPIEKLREGDCMGTFFIANNRNPLAFAEAARGLHLRFRLFHGAHGRWQPP